MPTKSKLLAPAAVAGALAGITTVVLRRMQDEYENRETLTSSTVAAMYGTYAAHAAALAWAAARRIGALPLPRRPALAAGVALATAGVTVALAGAARFGARQLSGVEPGALHTTGIYRYSRNPQYLGLCVAVTGVALAARSAFAGLLAGGVWWVYRHWIPHEERHLTRLFGQRYLDYQASAARWLGTPAPRCMPNVLTAPGQPRLTWWPSMVAR